MLQYLQLANKYKTQFNFKPMLYIGYIIQINPSYLLPISVYYRSPISFQGDDRLGVKRLIKGEAFAEAPNRRLAVFSIIPRPYTNFLTRPRACLPACLPTCLSSYLPTYQPTYLPACVPAYLRTYLRTYLPTYISL